MEQQLRFYGVPKKRTSKPKIMTRKFAYHRIIKESLITGCQECGSITGLSPSTVCLKCYDVIRVESMKTKRKMMEYNPYIGERQKPIDKNSIEETK